VRFLLVSGGISVLLTAGAALLVVGDTLGRLGAKIGVVCMVGPVLAAANTYYTADNMLIRSTDVGLLILLLICSAVVGIALAFALAHSLTARISHLAMAARSLGGGDLLARAPEEARDEVGNLGRVLNEMAERLQDAATHQRELERARRLLLAAVSHDLRTPLTALRAVLEALNDRVVDDQKTMSRYLLSAHQQVLYLEQLIDDLFELARLDAGALELRLAPASATDLIAATVQAMHSQAHERRVQLEDRSPSALPPVLLDRPRVQRVLLNLVGNAIRHTPEGGRVEMLAEREGPVLRLTVRDNGEGIAAADLPHLFERFYRGEQSRSRQHGGAGLGLAIARGLVEAHGGCIWAESTAGAGTSIHFTLPLAPALG
jgi:signal transduction histidine kinase